MPAEPLVSIVMPAYNAAAYIGEAVDSVLAQTWMNWELIVVDDGSTDGTSAYLDGLADPRIRVIHQVNQGVSVARNAALDVATGEFITFLDADDVLPPDSLHVRTDFLLLTPDIHLVSGQISLRGSSLLEEIRRHKPRVRGELAPELLRLNPEVFCQLGSYLFRAQVAKAIRFKPGMTHSEDLLFFIQLASQQKMCYGCVGEVVYHYRTGHTSAMKNMPGLEGGYFTLIEEVRRLPGVTAWQMARLRLKIAKILLLSWGAVRQWVRGMRAAVTCLFACRGVS